MLHVTIPGDLINPRGWIDVSSGLREHPSLFIGPGSYRLENYVGVNQPPNQALSVWFFTWIGYGGIDGDVFKCGRLHMVMGIWWYDGVFSFWWIWLGDFTGTASTYASHVDAQRTWPDDFLFHYQTVKYITLEHRQQYGKCNLIIIDSAWCFGTYFTFPYVLGKIIPTDFHIVVQRGSSTTNQRFICSVRLALCDRSLAPRLRCW